MAELYLIAHRVRGEAAFDVALRMECPHCGQDTMPCFGLECVECDQLGYWWIIPTSGHRAYPYGWQPLSALDLAPGFAKPMPPGWPDHYKVGPAPKLDIKALFKATQPPQPRIPRRL